MKYECVQWALDIIRLLALQLSILKSPLKNRVPSAPTLPHYTSRLPHPSLDLLYLRVPAAPLQRGPLLHTLYYTPPQIKSALSLLVNKVQIGGTAQLLLTPNILLWQKVSDSWTWIQPGMDWIALAMMSHHWKSIFSPDLCLIWVSETGSKCSDGNKPSGFFFFF